MYLSPWWARTCLMAVTALFGATMTTHLLFKLSVC
jgi:hypothetical protein